LREQDRAGSSAAHRYEAPSDGAIDPRGAPRRQREEGASKMPKLKTKSSAKKRFKMTATGKVKVQAQGKRHGMIKRTAKFVRNARGTMVLCDSDANIVKKYMPYDR
jgi:large subunit ribosomal protein L35